MMNVDEQNALLDALNNYDDLVEAMRALADEWQRNEEVSADYQDGLADCAEAVNALLPHPRSRSLD